MLLSIRAGRPSRPCSGFVKLAKHRARARNGPLQWRLYATEVLEAGQGSSAQSKSLSSRPFPVKYDGRKRS